MQITNERDLVKRAIGATDLGVSLGAFARSNGLSYQELKKILERYEVRIEKRSRLVPKNPALLR